MSGSIDPTRWLIEISWITGLCWRLWERAGTAAHPTDGQLLLQVGEGQDGVALFSGEIADNRIRLVQYPWNDRCLIAVAPNGNQFMTVNHGQENVAFHSDPNGEVTLEFPISAFGHDPAESAMYWSGGYLTSDCAIVAMAGETEHEQEWFRHYRVDLDAGAILGEFSSHAAHVSDVIPLGDGTWLTTDPSGHPVRRTH